MKVEETWWGCILTIPETENNSMFEFKCRSVRKLNDNNKYEQKLIKELEEKEQRALRRLKLLLFSMENFLKQLPRTEKWNTYDRWEQHNRMDWNDWYHGQIRELNDEVNNYSFEYAERSKHGWCL